MEFSNKILEIEEQLASEQGARYRQELLEELHTITSEIKIEMDKGLTPEDFAVAEKLKEALELAATVVDKIGGELQPG